MKHHKKTELLLAGSPQAAVGKLHAYINSSFMLVQLLLLFLE